MPKHANNKASVDKASHPGAEYDSNGKITNWRKDWKEAKELEMLVQGGMLDGMGVPAIKEQYAQFQKFEYRPLYGALRNARTKNNKQVHDRANHGQGGGDYSGLKAHMSGAAVQEHYEGQTEEEADDDYTPSDPEAADDAVSCLSFDEEKTVSFKSVAPVPKSGGILKKGSGASGRPNTMSVSRGRTPLGLMYVLVAWKDADLTRRVSLQFHLPSGNKDFVKRINGRVSTKQTEYIISQPMSVYMMTPEGSLNTHILNQKIYKEDVSGGMIRMAKTLLHSHPKTIAFRGVISQIVGRDASKKVHVEDHRIPLPCKVEFAPVPKEQDDMFYGTKIVSYPDGTKHLHVELQGVKKDGFSPMKNNNIASDATYKSAKDVDGCFRSPVPSNISVNSFGYASARDSVAGSKDDASQGWESMSATHVGEVDDAEVQAAMENGRNEAAASLSSPTSHSMASYKTVKKSEHGKIKIVEANNKKRSVDDASTVDPNDL